MIAVLQALRLRAHRFALAVAVCQVAAVCSATILLAATPRAVAVVEEECRCEHSAAVMCPMHRRTSTRPVPVDAPRWCTGVDDSVFALLPTFGALAMPEQTAPLTIAEVRSLAPAVRAEAPCLLDRPPDSPPPRA